MNIKSIREVKVNLIPRSNTYLSSAERVLNWALNSGLYVIALTVFLVFGLHLTRWYLDRVDIKLDDMITEKKNVILDFKQTEDKVKVYDKKISIIKDVSLKFNIATLFPRVATLLPDGVILLSMKATNSTVELIGIAKDSETMNILLTNFIFSKQFTDTQVDKIEVGSKEYNTKILNNDIFGENTEETTKEIKGILFILRTNYHLEDFAN